MIYKAYLDICCEGLWTVRSGGLPRTHQRGCPHHKHMKAAHAVGVGVALETSSVSTSR